MTENSIKKFNAYKEYKNSGTDWLDDLPSHWRAENTKRMLIPNKKPVGEQSSKYQLLSLTLKGIIPRDISTGEGKIPADFRTYQIIDKNNLIFCLFDIDETPRTVGISHQKGMITGAYNVYNCTSGIHANYIYYYFLHIDSFKGLRPFYTGLRKVVRPETFGTIKIPHPPLIEQKQIANFLDHETAKIDALIEKQQQLIKLLKEKRQAVISHAVTKGLNPDAPMQDSGVEWLGKVPEHWIVTRLKYVTTIFEQGWSPQCESRPASENEYGILKVGCVNGGKFNSSENKALPFEIEPRLQYKITKGDLLISRANTKELVGSAAVVENDYQNLILCDKLYRLRFTECILPELMSFYLSTPVVRKQIELRATGASQSMQNIGQDTIKELPCLIMPLGEAKTLLHKSNSFVSRISETLSKAEQQIKLLKERRTSLISAAVTGKIDVRGWKPE